MIRSSPTRPYLITTDIFWELFASAYEGIFIIAERDQAIPNFWKFIEAADQYYKKFAIKSAWTSVFSSLNDLHSGNIQNPEVSRIMKTEGILHSDVLRKNFNYTELKPRSHYTSNETMKEYFMAFKYLTTISDTDQYITEDLNQLPAEVQNYAVKWIETYRGFISPSRSPLVWKSIQTALPLYNKKPKKELTVFPSPGVLIMKFSIQQFTIQTCHRKIRSKGRAVLGYCLRGLTWHQSLAAD